MLSEIDVESNRLLMNYINNDTSLHDPLAAELQEPLEAAPTMITVNDMNHESAVYTINLNSSILPPISDAHPEPQDVQHQDTQELGHLRRQVTFCIGVQTDHDDHTSRTDNINHLSPNMLDAGVFEAAVDSAAADQATTYGTISALQSPTRPRWRRIVDSVDCTTFCYLGIAGLMISVGILVTAVTAREKSFSGDESSGSAQLWIVGPIFISSGILVCVKAATHLCKRMNAASSVPQSGNYLRSDSRPSLRAIPPSYSKALVAPVPVGVVEEEDDDYKFPEAVTPKPGTDSDVDSLRLVSVNCEPPPPTYSEAVEVLRRYTFSDQNNKKTHVRDVGTQSGSQTLEENSASSSVLTHANEGVRIRNAFSDSNVAQQSSSATST